MTYQWKKDLRQPYPTAATFLPPATVEETAWDILLALYSHPRRDLSLDKLARVVSVREPVLDRWLGLLEQRQLITDVRDSFTGELRAVLTVAGRRLLDRYLSATGDLQVGACH